MMKMKTSHVFERAGVLPGLFLSILFAAATTAHAQIGTPGDIGSKETNISSASVSLITTQAVPAGASIIVIALGSAVSPGTTGSCSDSGGDPYSVDVSAGITDFAIICSTHKLAAPLGAGATITVMFSSIAVSGSNVHAFSVTGLAAAPLDKTASATGSNAAPSSGVTATTAQANELLFGAIVDQNTTVSFAGFSPGANGTSNNCAATGTPTYTSLGGVGSVTPATFGMSCVVSATGTY